MSFECEGEFECGQLVRLPADPGPSRRELALATRVLEMESEQELQGFLPFLVGPALAGLKALAVPALKAAGSAIAKTALPALKSIGGKLFSKLGGGVVRRVGKMAVRHGTQAVGDAAKRALERRQAAAQQRTRRQQALRAAAAQRAAAPQREQFLGDIVGGLFGENENENEQFLGDIVGGLFGENENENENEQFLGDIVGGLFGENENENENEQFLGDIVGGLFGEQELEGFLGGIVGSLFGELGEMTPAEAELETAVWFVRLAEDAATRAAGALQRRISAGRPVDAATIRAIVKAAITSSGKRILPAAGVRGELEGESEISKSDLAKLRSLANQIARKIAHRGGRGSSTKGKHEEGIARKARDILNSALRAIRNGASAKSEIARLQSWLDGLGELEMPGELEWESEGAMLLDNAIASLPTTSKDPGLYTLSRRNGKKLMSFSVGKSDDVRRRLVQHKNLIERLCGDSKDVLVTFRVVPPGTDLRAAELKRRAAREKAQGAKTRDKRELELAFAG